MLNKNLRTLLGKKFSALTALVCFCAGGPVAAQWLKYPTPGIPRTADGKPNLTAPAPKSFDGKPDLSGIWRFDALGYLADITSNLKSGDVLPWAEALSQRRVANELRDAPGSHCLLGSPTMVLFGLQKVVQAPGLVTILNDWGVFRQILMDGRSLPENPNPTWLGYSIGHWDGDMLVVETAGFNDKSWLDFRGHPHTEALRLTERFERKDFGHMQLRMTFDDPKTFTRAWDIAVEASLVPDTELLEFVCNENERDAQHLVGELTDERKSDLEVPRVILAKYVGTYHSVGMDVGITVSDSGSLMVNINGKGTTELLATSQTTFYYPGLGGQIEFFADARGKVTHLTLDLVEAEIRAQRN